MKHFGLYMLNHLREPEPVEDAYEWAKWFGTADRRVANDVMGGVRVSTVFLGIDHNHTLSGPPLLFETLVFGGKLDGDMDRCSTWQQAEAMHKRMLDRVIWGKVND